MMFRKTTLALALAFACAGAVQAADLLFYGPSIAGFEKGIPENEVEVAMDDGHNVTVVDDSEWAGMTQNQFASYDAIIFGDEGCESEGADFDVPNDTKTTWSPVITGPVIINTFDPFAHQEDNPGTIILTSNSMNVASSGPGTGLYFASSCRASVFPEAPTKGDEPDFFILDFLSEIGDFVMQNAVPGGGTVNGDEVFIVDSSSPVVQGLTNNTLGGWGNSTHAFIESFPSDFTVVATGRDCVSNNDDKDPSAGHTHGKGEACVEPDEKGDLEVFGVVLITRGARATGPIPTLSPVGLGLLGLVLAGLGGFVARRRRR